MFRKIALILLLIIVPATAFSEVTYYKLRIRNFTGERGLFINDKMIGTDWGFKYFSYPEGSVSSGDIDDGPMISYTSIVITGEITLPYLHKDLINGLANGQRFKIDYILNTGEARDDQAFGECIINDVQMTRNASGEGSVLYSFRVGKVL